MREAEKAHAAYEATVGHRDEDWPTWSAPFLINRFQQEQRHLGHLLTGGSAKHKPSAPRGRTTAAADANTARAPVHRQHGEDCSHLVTASRIHQHALCMGAVLPLLKTCRSNDIFPLPFLPSLLAAASVLANHRQSTSTRARSRSRRLSFCPPGDQEASSPLAFTRGEMMKICPS